MKKTFAILLGLIVGALVSCGGTKATLTIADMTIMVGETKEVVYTLEPTGLFAQTSLEVVSSDPADTISIDGMNISALKTGTASVKATAENMPGASNTFSAVKTFTVTITPIEAPAGQFVLNGGFEYGLFEWDFVPDKTYNTTVVDNVPHEGDFALNLWFDEDADTVSDDMDMTFTQTTEQLNPETYLFSLWYQGSADSITMTILDGLTTLVTDTFSGFDYKPVPDHFGYVQLGIELTLATQKSLTLSINAIGTSGFWGYIDEVSLMVGTLDDLLVAPANAETLYVNHITNGGFADNSSWTVEITGTAVSKQANFSNGKLRIWTNGPAILKIYQSITVTDDLYSMCIYLNGGVFGSGEYSATDSYAYALQGLVQQELDIEPSGWGDGSLTRIEKSAMTLYGTIEVGIYINFTGGTNNWVDLDDFALWSYNQPN